MNDPEVVRLRRLRQSALRMRALAFAFSTTRMGSHDPCFQRLAQAGWRIARTVTGRLRSHPYASYQRDPGVLVLAAYAALAWLAARLTLKRAAALGLCLGLLRPLARQLDDARALTWLPDLSDTLGRSQAELRGLLDALVRESGSGGEIAQRPGPGIAAGPRRPGELPAIEGEWPYLAF